MFIPKYRAQTYQKIQNHGINIMIVLESFERGTALIITDLSQSKKAHIVQVLDNVGCYFSSQERVSCI